MDRIFPARGYARYPQEEVAIQRSLSDGSVGSYQPMWDEFSIETLFEEPRSFFENHPASKEKRIEYPDAHPGLLVKTDISLLLRVLCNMIVNAVEASEKNDTVSLWSEHKKERIDFCVWNSQVIPPEISKRIFQRNFSTKSQAGRGIGTYSMKFFGEKILGGKVNFSSSKENGTIFTIFFPCHD